MRTASRIRAAWQHVWRAVAGEAAREIDEELRSHIELDAWHRVRAGATPEQARRDAEARFGDVRRIARDCRRTTLPWPAQVLRTAARSILLLAAFAGLTATLVVGVAVHMRAPVLLAEGPWVSIWKETPPETPGSLVSYQDYDRWKARSDLFASVTAARYESRDFGVEGRVRLKLVSPGYLDAHGIRPLLGETLPGRTEGPEPILIARDFWVDQFEGDPDIVGREVNVGGRTHRIVGVLPASFRNYFPTQVVATLPTTPEERSHTVLVSGRLRPGITLEVAQAALTAADRPHGVLPLVMPARAAYAFAFRTEVLVALVLSAFVALAVAVRWMRGRAIGWTRVDARSRMTGSLSAPLPWTAYIVLVGLGLYLGQGLAPPLAGLLLGASQAAFDTSPSVLASVVALCAAIGPLLALGRHSRT